MLSADKLRGFLWCEWFWLPNNITWHDLAEYTQDFQLFDIAKHCFLVACLLSILRMLLTSVLFLPVGLFFGLKIPVRNKLSSAPTLETVFAKNRRPNKEMIEVLSKDLKMSVNAIEFWFHNRRNVEKKPSIVKFSESGWKLCFYSTMFIYGAVVLKDKEYLYNVQLALENYPNYRIPVEIYWYYAIELAYYISELFWVFYGVRRSDFLVLLVHHMATVGLLAFSYVINHHRIGALVLFLHDIADCFMESAKMFKYVKKHYISEVLFYVFVFVWIVTRLIYFPFWIIYSILITYRFNGYPAQRIIVGWLILLQAMHIYWFFLIIKIAIQLKTQGDSAKDCRSDSDTSDDVNYGKEVANGNDHKGPLLYCNGVHASANSDSVMVFRDNKSSIPLESQD